MDKRNTGYLGRKVICGRDYSTPHACGNGFWSNRLRRLIRDGFWCCASTDEQICLATLKPSVSQIGGSSMGEVSLWQMPAARTWIEWTVHLAAYNYITQHGTISLSPSLPHPPRLFWDWLCSCGTDFIMQIWVESPLPAKKCFAEVWLLSRQLFLSHLVLLFRPFDLIPASVVLFVLLLVPRILLLFWSLKPFPQSQSQSVCPWITAVIHQTKGRLWQYSLWLGGILTPGFKKIFCGQHWLALWVSSEGYILPGILCLWCDGCLFSC